MPEMQNGAAQNMRLHLLPNDANNRAQRGRQFRWKLGANGIAHHFCA
jgi:hypothetical protein